MASDTGPDRPNVLFLFTDDQRFDTIAALGNDRIITPNLDRLVGEGTAFTHAHIMGGSVPAVCMPSRAMLMTGRHLFGIDGYGQEIAEEHALLGETFREAGYETFGTGKWHNGTRGYARSFSDGAEIYFGGMGDHWNVPACDFDPTGRYDRLCPRVVDFSRQAVVTMPCDHIHPGRHSSELFCDAAIDFLRRHDGGRPFLAYVSFMAPHDPRTMPAEYREMYDPERLPLPPNFLPEHPFDNGDLRIRDERLAAFPRSPEETRRHIADYYAMITHADAHLGRVLRALEETGQAENTIIVFSGDNGLAVGQHGLMGKQNLYDHSVRVPLVFRGPGVPAGERRETLCYLHDLFPTLCELTGIPVPDTVQGRSLAPALGDSAAPHRQMLHLAYRGCQRAVRDERFKLIEYAVQGQRTTQLFDLESDPVEMHNLADAPAHAAELSRLRGALCRWRDELEDTRELSAPFWQALDSQGSTQE